MERSDSARQARRRELESLIERALFEDSGGGDLTSRAVLDKQAVGALALTARQPLVVAGLDACRAVLSACDQRVRFEALLADGQRAAAGQRLAIVRGPLAALLRGERPALNLLQFMCAIASQARSLCERLKGLETRLLDSRKTVPGLRRLSKYAAACGGALNHRFGLDDGVLIKDNHIAAAAAVAAAVERCSRGGVADFVVECDSLEQVKQALAAGAKKLLLDNMSIAQLTKAVRLARGRATTEASGGVSAANIRAIAMSGVDYVSSGRMTLFPAAVDIGFDWLAERAAPAEGARQKQALAPGVNAMKTAS